MKIFITLLGIIGLSNIHAQSNNLYQPDSLPVSEIDIPIRLSLKPFYKLAENNVDTVFTSPDYPKGWVESDCATRYKYHFKRSPLRMTMNGNTLNLGFTGLYKIIGSTRVCVGGAVISPWTPECKCGFEEGERKVEVGFTGTFRLERNYILNTKIIRQEPRALTKCTVCFWGQDITNTVMNGLKKELDLSKKLMEDSFSTINLRPYIQLAWNKLNESYSLGEFGYINLHPKKLRMQNMYAKNDLLHMNLGITATPVVSFIKADSIVTKVPDLSVSSNNGGFHINLEAALQYDSLSNVLNGYLANKRFDLSEGIIKKHIIVERAKLDADENGNMLIQLDFIGSFSGTAFFSGIPTYNTETKTIEIKDLDYDIRTKNLFLKTAKWLFNKKIVNSLKEYSSIPLSNYYDSATLSLNAWLNKEWTKGIKGEGNVTELDLNSVHALKEHLLIRSSCKGKLSVLVSEIDLNF
ncbi:MAG TPA: DUF4403 family protein [Chitinophagaceae bacterium]